MSLKKPKQFIRVVGPDCLLTYGVAVRLLFSYQAFVTLLFRFRPRVILDLRHSPGLSSARRVACSSAHPNVRRQRARDVDSDHGEHRLARSAPRPSYAPASSLAQRSTPSSHADKYSLNDGEKGMNELSQGDPRSWGLGSNQTIGDVSSRHCTQ